MLYPDERDQHPITRLLNKVKRDPWPYGIVLFILIFVTCQFSMVAIASRHFEGPDEVQYYKMGLEYSKEVQRQKLQRDLGWHLQHNLAAKAELPATLDEPTSSGMKVLPYQSQPFEWSAQILDSKNQPVKGQLHLTMKRPVTKKDDAVILVSENQGQYHATLPLKPGTWVVDCQFETEKMNWHQSFRVRMQEHE